MYKELTIGSFVIHEGTIKPVTGLTQDFIQLDQDTNVINKCDILPVRITGELLLKIGFKKDETTKRMFGCEAYETPNKRICMRRIDQRRKRSWNIYIDNESCNTVANADVEYLHQMQTELANQGVELEIQI